MSAFRGWAARFTLSGTIAITVVILSAFPARCGAQSFPNPPTIATGDAPRALAAADFNGDGKVDLAYISTGASPTLHLLFGDGKGGFSPAGDVALPAGTCTFEIVSCRVIAADFNHDKAVDLLMPANLSSGTAFVVLPGNGDGTFGAPIESVFNVPNTLGQGFVGLGPAVADLNGDSNLDIAEPDYYNGNVDVFLGDGTGRFTQGPIFNDPSPTVVYAADLNGDSHPDLVILDQTGHYASVWLGNGSGGFVAGSALPAGSYVVVYAADLNGDGKLDLLANDGSGNLLALTGKGDGTFNAPQPLVSGFEASNSPRGTYVAVDLTGSGLASILTTSLEGFQTAVPAGSLAYGAPQNRTAGIFSTPPVTVDLNGDGIVDMAVGTPSGIELFFGNKSGLFPDNSITPLSTPSLYFFAGDFTGDGIADVVAVGQDKVLRTYPGSSTGTFQPAIPTPTPLTQGTQYIGNTVGDFDGDGHQDILESNQILFGNGDGTFTPVAITSPANGLVADLNNDGKSDLVSISGPLGNPVQGYGLIASLGSNQRTFTQITTPFPANPPGAGIETPVLLGVGDLNSDGKPDAAVYEPNLQALEVSLGKGDGTFTAGSLSSTATVAWTPIGTGGQGNGIGVGAIVDVDGDGHQDVAFLATFVQHDSTEPQAGALVIEYGDGNGGFTQTQVISLSHAFSYMAPVRLDATAKHGFAFGNECAVAVGNCELSVIRNLGNRTFSNERTYGAGALSGLVSADFNGDGLSDLLALRANVYLATGGLAFTVLMDQGQPANSGSWLVNGALAANPSSVNFNQAFTLTATVAPTIAGNPSPTGTVDFSTPDLDLGTATLTNGTATLQVPASVTQTLSPGILIINGSYSGDASYGSATLFNSLMVLNPVYSTQTQLEVSAGPNPIVSAPAGNVISLTASVSAPAKVPHGYIAFYDGTAVIGQVEISNQQAILSTNLLAIGSHSLSAQYLGFTPPNAMLGTSSFQASTSAVAPLTITAIPTTTTASNSGSSTTAGTVFTVTAQVTSSSGTPAGGVTFLDGSTVLGVLALDQSGVSTFSTASLTQGSHTITAEYQANGPYAASTSQSSSVTVNVANPVLMPTATAIVQFRPALGGGLLTAAVTGASEPQGVVSAIVDGRLAGAAQVGNDASAAIPVSLSGGGVHTIVASYAGSSISAPSASPALETTAYSAASDFMLQGDRSEISMSGDSGATLHLAVTPVGVWSGTVSLSCLSGVPQGYACAFSPATVDGSGTAMLTIRPERTIPLGAVMLPLICLFLRRKRWTTLCACLLLGAVLSATACGRTAPAIQTSITVRGTSGSLVHSVQFTLRMR